MFEQNVIWFEISSWEKIPSEKYEPFIEKNKPKVSWKEKERETEKWSINVELKHAYPKALNYYICLQPINDVLYIYIYITVDSRLFFI